ncbi:MAG: retroviral-like aspartic protease family protein [bacterium]|nr:retroviral-like aspartic protease family protein [bacterium]MDE0352096.1 retroviral-like aspartic protease family protein [bacterium]
MPCLSGEYDPTVGILLQVAVLPGGTFEQQSEGEARVFSGLVDTGADVTCISNKVADFLDLQSTGKVPMVGATGSDAVNQYLVDLLLQFGTQHIGIPDHRAASFEAGSPHYDVLIGRDILCKGVLTMDFAGRFTFSV